MREGTFLFTPCPVWIRFCQTNFHHKFQHFLELKIDINQVIWRSVKLIVSYKNYPQVRLKMSFYSSCQLGINSKYKSTYFVCHVFELQVTPKTWSPTNSRIMPIPACAYKNNFNSFDTFMNKCRPSYVCLVFFIPFFRQCTVIFSVKNCPKIESFAKIKSSILYKVKFRFFHQRSFTTLINCLDSCVV